MTKYWEPMLAVNIDDIDDLVYPLMGSPKLNGIRACWTGKELVSRQQEIFSSEIIPHIYEKLNLFSSTNPGIILDGELYAHGMPLQEIMKRVTPNRKVKHADAKVIDFHAFDIISTDDTESRQITLAQIYKPWVAVCKVNNNKELNVWLNRFCEAGFEGLMLRVYSCPYLNNRTEALIKVKPWKFDSVTIVDSIEGTGKFENKLGALIVTFQGKRCKVGGGNITENQRELLWKTRDKLLGKGLAIKYRELSKLGIPLQPQIVRI